MTEPLSNDPRPDIPDFELIREIGRGGFGQVWLARNHATGLLRAVKWIARSSPGDPDPASLEVVSITRLESVRHRQHPNLLDIQHVGQTADCVFFVTDLADHVVEGRSAAEVDYTPATLEQRLSGGAATPSECLDWTRQLLQGLASLHEAGMAHCDVKPANCLFVGGQLKLADFGLLTEADSPSLMGTQAYMPPDGRMDTRADVYAAGLVIYEMITGYPVERFPQLADRADRVASDPILSLLLRLVLEACQTSPEARFADASAMLAALEKARSDEARPPRLGNRTILAVAAIVVAGLLIWRGSRPQVQPSPVIPRVHVNFVTDPFGASVWLNGVRLMDGNGDPALTPCTIDNLPARPHQVVFRHPDHPGLTMESVDFARMQQIVVPLPHLLQGSPEGMPDDSPGQDAPGPSLE